ncbi:hypothetical protein KRM28CT15_51800 [Krasilnikovia sp. M28-CT-15]
MVLTLPLGQAAASDVPADRPVRGGRRATAHDRGVRPGRPARTDAGRRDTNEDAAHATDGLLAVADGIRGPGGAQAAAAAIAALAGAAKVDPAALLATVEAADRAVTGLAGPVTTLTALCWSGTRLGLIHIGDTRAYLLRHGELARLTQDHSYVQTLVDQGELPPGEAAGHPQRALLVRALGAGPGRSEADIAVRTALLGDRYLLCSDGLWAVTGDAALRDALAAGGEPGDVVDRLVDLAYAGGAPDNIACVVADVVEA